jgi:heat shock protein 5
LYSELTTSVQRGGKVEIIANDQGNRITPSWVAFTEEERLIGDAAKNQAAQNPYNTVFDAKRLIGRPFDDADVKRDIKHWPFKIVNKGGKPMVQVNHRGDLRDFVSRRDLYTG